RTFLLHRPGHNPGRGALYTSANGSSMQRKKQDRAAGSPAKKALRAGGNGPSRDELRSAEDFRSASRELREVAMGLPGATEDFPWGGRVAKVNGKVFVFLGVDPVPGGPMGLSVKLPS